MKKSSFVLCVLLSLSLVLSACSPGEYITELFNFEAGKLQVNDVEVDPTTAPTHSITGDAHTFPDGGASTQYLGADGSFHTIPSGNGSSGVELPYADAGAANNFFTSYDNVTGTFGKSQPTIANVSGLQTTLDGKQSTLVSGTNIKTINGSSVLGAGDLAVTAGDHSHTADNITGGAANQFIKWVSGVAQWIALTLSDITTALGYTPADNTTAMAHYSNTSNPHSVTPAQIGAVPTSNVSYTAAANKIPTTNGGGTIDPNYVPTFTSSAKGAVPASGGGTTNFLRADGTFAAPPGGTSPVTKVITANSATTSTSLVDIGDLFVTLSANTNYLIEAGWNETVSAVTTGIRYGVGANFTLTSMELQITARIAAATVGMERVSANNTATANAFATVSGSTNNAVTVFGIVRVGASGGNLSFKHLKVTSGTATALALGWIRATPISVP